MSKNDDLKNRLNELFSTFPASERRTSDAGSIIPDQRLFPTSEIDLTQDAAFQSAFEFAAIGMALTTLDGRLIRVNDAFCQMLGYSSEELKGATFQSITHEEDRAIGSQALKSMLSGEARTAQFQKRYVHKNGDLIWVELNITLLCDELQLPLHFVSIIQDITSQRLTSMSLDKRVRELDCLNDIGHKIEEKPEIPEFLDWVAQRIPAAFLEPKLCTAAIEYNHQIFGDRDVLDLPSRTVGGLRVQGVLVGYVQVAYREPKSIVDTESSLLSGIVSRVGSYLESRQLIDEITKHAQVSASMSEMSRALMDVKSLDGLMDRVFEFTTRFMDTTNFYIALFDSKTGIISFPRCVVDNRTIEVPSRPIGAQGITDYIVTHKTRVLLSDNVPQGMHDLGIEFVAMGNDRPALSWLGVPIIYINQVIGVIALQSVTTSCLYGENEEEILSSIANQTANALQLIQQHQSAQDALTASEMLYTGTARIIEAATEEGILKALVESTILKLYDRAFIMVFDRPWQKEAPALLKISAVYEKYDQPALVPAGTVYELPTLPFAVLDQRAEPVWIRDIESDDRLDETGRAFLGFLGKSLVLLPLLAGGAWIGWVAGLNGSPVDLQSDDIRRTMSLVDQAGTVFESLHLRDTMQKQVQELSSLQRLMSREAWSSSISNLNPNSIGYTFDRIDIRPIAITEAQSPEDGSVDDTASVIPQLQGAYATTLAVRGEPIGILGIEPAVESQLSPDDEEFLAAISEQVSQALERARLMEQTRKSAVELEAVADVSTTTASVLDPTSLLQEVVDLTKERFGLYHAHIYLLDEQSKYLKLAAGTGSVGHRMVAEGWSIPVDREASIVSRAARSRQGQLVGNVDEDPQFLPNPHLPETRSELAVPIIVADQVLGVFDVQSDVVGRFSTEDIRTYSTLSSQVGVALQNARLFHETNRRNEELLSMNQVASAVSRTLDLDQVLGEILQNVLAITEFDSGLISYVDPDTDQLVLAVHHNLPPVMVEKLIAKGMGGTACDLVFQTGKTVHVPDFERIPGEVLQLAELLNESWPHEGVAPVFIGPKAMGFQAYLGAPLTAKGSQLGTVCVFNKTPRVASSGRIALTQAIGQQVGVAVVNARLYAEQLRTVERLRELDSMKSAFLANMSHELRTPLNSILGFAQVIIEGLDGPLTETMAADLDLIEKNGKHLLHLINDVLDLARIEAGRLSLNPEPTSIYNLLEDVMQSNAPLVREKSLDLRLIADPDCDWTAEVDQIRMRQICINLIGNGVKFTENGGIYIELEKLYAVPERGSNLIQVRIRDTGIGIPQDKLEEIFEAFSQVDASTTRKVGGTGLGLPISRRLVEMHGGRLWAESEGIGKGSTFYLDLPVVQQQT